MYYDDKKKLINCRDMAYISLDIIANNFHTTDHIYNLIICIQFVDNIHS